MEAIWREVCGSDGRYEVSNAGAIRKVATQKLVHQYISSNGYMRASIYMDGRYRTVAVHRIIAQAFVSNPDGKPQVNHIDGNKTNNALSNLEWVTASENIQHAYDYLGKISPAKGHAFNRKLTDSQVRKIRDSSMSCYKLARIYGVTPSAIWAVKNRKSFVKVI